MRLLLIRHGESANNAAYAATGQRTGRVAEPELTPLGHRQATALGAALAAHGAPGIGPITALLSSPMLRAVQTAAHLGRALGLPVALCVEAFESGGVYDLDHDTGERNAAPSATLAELAAQCPGLLVPAGTPDPWWSGPHEEAAARLPRARRLLDRLSAEHTDATGVVALVAHRHFAQYLIAATLGLPERLAAYLTQANTGSTLLSLGERPAITWSNDLSHLPGEMRSGL